MRPALVFCTFVLGFVTNVRHTTAADDTPTYDPQEVATLASEARLVGVAERGVAVFAAAKFACLSCHKVGRHGGAVGPELTAIGKDRSVEQIVESILWPKREVKPEFHAVSVLTTSGILHRGYKAHSDDQKLTLRDPTTGRLAEIRRDEIDEEVETGTLMPDGLAAAMSTQQQRDLVRFLSGLGRDESPSLAAIESILKHAAVHGPEKFAYDRAPLEPQNWPSWQHPVNRDRVYDFYTKQAEHFRGRAELPLLLEEFPGLDGGKYGHWGNQEEQTWADGRWNETKLGSVQCGVFRSGATTVARGVCVQLGDNNELSVCFNPDTLSYDVAWSGGFVKFSSVRHGFVSGLEPIGSPVAIPTQSKPEQPFVYHGFYRHKNRVVFAYRIGDTEYLDSPWVEDGKFVRLRAPANSHPLRDQLRGGQPRWPERIDTRIIPGTGRPYAVDTIELPYANPWKALMFCGDHDFLPDGSALVCTMQGDVWRVTGLQEGSATATWRRFASGLHHALGLVVSQDGIFVQCRDQITRLHDFNDDGEADFYECFSNAFETSPAGHDFICGLQRDIEGNFYTASGNQGVVRISADGKRADVLAVGFRNPDGLGLYPDGVVTVPCSEGEWTPSSMICAVRPSNSAAQGGNAVVANAADIPSFGYRGPRNGVPPEFPFAYLPRGLDNSSGGQAFVSSDRWGPLQGRMLHFSFGAGTHSLLLRDEVDGQLQGAIVPLPGEFLSGAHRGRFNPADGQLYVSGMAGWGSYTPDDGCFQRVRYTGDRVQLPNGFHVHQNGVTVAFTEPIDEAVAEQPGSHFAQCWNYRYSAAYGSAEFSTRHSGTRGHDPLKITSAHVLPDGRTLFLEIPDLQPTSQLHLRLNVESGKGHDLFLTVHKLDKPFTNFDGYTPIEKIIAAHPMIADLSMIARSVPNPWLKSIKGARRITLATGTNLTFATPTLTVKRGEPIEFTLANPDVVPHNWALVKPNSLRRVGDLANRLVADPDAVARHYVPESDDVLIYTDVVAAQSEMTIFFRAPSEPGRYPYLCTFPGHWMVMNGEMIVE